MDSVVHSPETCCSTTSRHTFRSAEFGARWTWPTCCRPWCAVSTTSLRALRCDTLRHAQLHLPLCNGRSSRHGRPFFIPPQQEFVCNRASNSCTVWPLRASCDSCAHPPKPLMDILRRLLPGMERRAQMKQWRHRTRPARPECQELLLLARKSLRSRKSRQQL